MVEMNTLIEKPNFDFELDEHLCVVWLVWQFDRFRINCQDYFEMSVWAVYYYYKEFPMSSENERQEFKHRFRAYYADNEEKINECARILKIKRREALADLLREIKERIKFSANERPGFLDE